jgi:hypothetical protein
VGVFSSLSLWQQEGKYSIVESELRHTTCQQQTWMKHKTFIVVDVVVLQMNVVKGLYLISW